MIPAGLRERAEGWIAGDPDPETRAQLRALLDAGDASGLADHVDGELTFGTAGLRGAVGPGPLRMNRAVVIRATRGLVDYLRASLSEAERRGVVVGFDARPDSRRFALDAVGVLLAAGFEVHWFDTPTATPLVAHAAKRLEAAGAIVVTASHNPPADNGFKVYGADAAQIVEPTDTAIAAAIDAVGPAAEVPREADVDGHERLRALGDDAFAAYRTELTAALPPLASDARPRIVYTPLHGVARDPVVAALADAGHTDVHVVAAQGEPDGAFPTVAFPNPEEPGALDLALDLAREVDADLVLANDPDGDRLAVAVPSRRGPSGWRALTGNQIGALLADHLLGHTTARQPLIVSSIVSSPLLADVAAAHGAAHATTLTGFKWIMAAAADLRASTGADLVLGCEEALGYSIGGLVRDKDGISAAVAFANLTAELAAGGRSVEDALDALHRRHGLWVGVQRSVVRTGADGLAEIAAAMTRIDVVRRPRRLGGRDVTGIVDYRVGAAERPRWLPATPLVACLLGDAGRALVRPSGTEPKLKVYVDLRGEAGDDPESAEADLLARARVAAAELTAFLGLD